MPGERYHLGDDMDLIFLSGAIGMAQIVPVAAALAVGLSSGMICGALLARGRSRGGAGDGVAPVPALPRTVADIGPARACATPTPGRTVPTPCGAAPTLGDGVPAVLADADPTPVAAPPKPRPARLRIVSAPKQAQMLMSWCAAEGGISGKLTAAEIMAVYNDMCIWQDLEPLAWNVVAPEIRELTSGARKLYGYRDGRRIRVYPIPMPGTMASAVGQPPARLVATSGALQAAA